MRQEDFGTTPSVEEISRATRKALRRMISSLPDEAGKAIITKFDNINGKTGAYNVPDDLFQKRTPRRNRCLIAWEDVKKNGLTLEQLETFEGGVVVEFTNSDFFDESENSDVFKQLRTRLGSAENVSAMISVRAEGGTSDSRKARIAFEKLESRFPNWRSNIIRRKPNLPHGEKNVGNDKIEGFVYVNIAGGQQDTTRSHVKQEWIFNPACEYANSQISEELKLVLVYFAMHSVDRKSLSKTQSEELEQDSKVLEGLLRRCIYDDGNLLDYCQNHISLLYEKGLLYDAIQAEPIFFVDFAQSSKGSLRTLNLTHNEAVEKGIFKYDNTRQTILSAARPNNVFWSRELSNMMQQNMTLQDFFDFEETLVKRRAALLDGKS